MNSRDRILAAVRAGLPARDVLGEAPTTPRHRPAELETHEGRLDGFAERLRAAHGELTWLPAGEDPLDAVGERLRQAGARSLVLGGGRAMASLSRGLSLRGFRMVPPDAPTLALMRADAGITAAQWGVAETGTVVLDDRVARARRASLLPPLHIAVLDQRRLLASLDDLFDQPEVRTAPPHALTLITGPSRTADIELQLVVGAHGPRELLVVLV